MFFPDFKEFEAKARLGNVIPVYREILADLETPVSAYLKLAEPPSFLLESVVGGEKWGRYSFIGMGARRLVEGGRQGAFDRLKAELDRFRPVDVEGLPIFSGGLVGYFAYDIVREIENLPDRGHEGLGLPDVCFMLADTLVVFDNFSQRIKVVANVLLDEATDIPTAYAGAKARIDGVIERLRRPVPLPARGAGKPVPAGAASGFRSNFDRPEDFKEAVRKAKDYIRAGDVFQVVLSQRFSVPLSAAPFDVYRSLRVINPSPYMYYLDTGRAQIAGSSPEILVRLEEGRVVLRPIAGTRRRGRSDEEDRALEAEMKADPKERAEHIMLVDLGRNDVGRVAETGSVKVTELFAVERYSHVMHMVSNVEGRLREGLDAMDVIRACFPAGTVSGAPKVRAMEIIEELEPARRGPYAGSLGYFGFSGNMDMCITIRTLVIRDGTAYVQAGAGIVADSDPDLEYKETVNKALGMMKAVEMAERGLEAMQGE